MAEIRDGKFVRNETNQNSMGGTERLTMELANRLPTELSEKVHIVSSRMRELQDDRLRIFWSHDLPGDPESEFLKDPNNHNKFHRYVFVSNWQMQQYISYYKLPWSKCVVIENAINPIPEHTKPDDGLIRFVYTPTPHRGLNILLPVFDALRKKYSNIHLDIFSSFKLYGWEQRDKEYQELFEFASNHPGMTYHGTVSIEEIREHLQQSHIFVYPSTWMETSCLCLIEAMSARLVSIHSNYGALYETSKGMTHMYQYNEDPNNHASHLYSMCSTIIENFESSKNYLNSVTQSTKTVTDMIHSWDYIIQRWIGLIRHLDATITDRKIADDVFTYRT